MGPTRKRDLEGGAARLDALRIRVPALGYLCSMVVGAGMCVVYRCGIRHGAAACARRSR